MQFPDVNVLVEAFREDAVNHARCRAWYRQIVDSGEILAVADVALVGFVRIVTHPRIFATATPLEVALRWSNEVREADNCVVVTPGARHWEVFSRLCNQANARGNLITDAHLAALAIESGCEIVTLDGDFARFPGLRWRRP